jgi:hypothetical protein
MLLGFLLWGLIKGDLQNQNTQKRELLHHIMDAAAYIQEHCKMIQQAVNSCLKLAMLCIEN